MPPGRGRAGLAGPEGIGIAVLEAGAAHVERHRVGGVGLELDGVGPAWVAASTIARARSRLWLWLPLISAITNGGWSSQMGRPAISIVMELEAQKRQARNSSEASPAA